MARFSLKGKGRVSGVKIRPLPPAKAMRAMAKMAGIKHGATGTKMEFFLLGPQFLQAERAKTRIFSRAPAAADLALDRREKILKQAAFYTHFFPLPTLFYFTISLRQPNFLLFAAPLQNHRVLENDDAAAKGASNLPPLQGNIEGCLTMGTKKIHHCLSSFAHYTPYEKKKRTIIVDASLFIPTGCPKVNHNIFLARWRFSRQGKICVTVQVLFDIHCGFFPYSC